MQWDSQKKEPRLIFKTRDLRSPRNLWTVFDHIVLTYLLCFPPPSITGRNTLKNPTYRLSNHPHLVCPVSRPTADRNNESLALWKNETLPVIYRLYLTHCSWGLKKHLSYWLLVPSISLLSTRLCKDITKIQNLRCCKIPADSNIKNGNITLKSAA